MQANELKALLAKTSDVAIKPVHVGIDIETPRNKRRAYYCPTNLVKATVIEDGFEYVERRPLSMCGDQDYEIKRRNGVLVEIDPDNCTTLKIKGNQVVADGSAYPYASLRFHDGKKYIQLITSRKAVFAAWSEYSLIDAARAKEREEAERRQMMLREPQAALFGMTVEEFSKHYVNANTRDACEVYLHAEWTDISKRDAKGNTKFETVTTADGWTREQRVIDHSVGKIQITLDQAHKILSMLTPKQKKELAS